MYFKQLIINNINQFKRRIASFLPCLRAYVIAEILLRNVSYFNL